MDSIKTLAANMDVSPADTKALLNGVVSSMNQSNEVSKFLEIVLKHVAIAVCKFEEFSLIYKSNQEARRQFAATIFAAMN